MEGSATNITNNLELMSILGHELRRPLTVIRGAATLLLQSRDEMPAESVSQLLALVDSHTLLMSDLIEDLLTVCHLEAGDVQIYSSAVKVANVVTPVVESLRKLEERPILVIGAAPDLAVDADESRAAQALRMVVDNAIRYSPPESQVEVSISADPRHVRFEVLDRGPGVRAEHREMIFQRFSRVSDRGAGMGVGLYIARGLIERMGGRIGVKARPDGGSVFWFTLNRSGGG